MSHKESLHSRAAKLIPIFDKKHGEVELVLKVLDLENELREAKAALQAAQNESAVGVNQWEFPNSIEISEFADSNGVLRNPPGEKTWVETLRHKTKLDVRAILSELPTEVGFYTFSFAYKCFDKLLYARVNVWVVAVREGS